MKRSVLIGSLLLISVLLSTCKKDEGECPCQYEQGFQQVKDWMYFKTGSYWIYQEENSGAIDTLTVWEDWEGTAQEVNDAFYTYTVSSYDGYFYRYRYNSSFSTQCLALRTCQCEKVSRSKSRPGNFVGDDRIFFFPPVLGNWSAAGSGVSEVLALNSSLVLGIDSVALVASYHVEDDLSESHRETIYDLVKHIGIVRKELVQEQEIWNLIEYDVIQ